MDAGKFLTGFSAVGSIAIPAILAHAQVRGGVGLPTRPSAAQAQALSGWQGGNTQGAGAPGVGEQRRAVTCQARKGLSPEHVHAQFCGPLSLAARVSRATFSPCETA